MTSSGTGARPPRSPRTGTWSRCEWRIGTLKAESYCWTSTRTLAVFAAAAALLGAFVAIERRAVAPLVPFDIFRLRTVSGANLTMLFAGAATFGLFYFLSLSMQQALGYSALEDRTGPTAAGGHAHPGRRDRLPAGHAPWAASR